jgi:hypothetical protein
MKRCSLQIKWAVINQSTLKNNLNPIKKREISLDKVKHSTKIPSNKQMKIFKWWKVYYTVPRIIIRVKSKGLLKSRLCRLYSCRMHYSRAQLKLLNFWLSWVKKNSWFSKWSKKVITIPKTRWNSAFWNKVK